MMPSSERPRALSRLETAPNSAANSSTETMRALASSAASARADSSTLAGPPPSEPTWVQSIRTSWVTRARRSFTEPTPKAPNSIAGMACATGLVRAAVSPSTMRWRSASEKKYFLPSASRPSTRLLRSFWDSTVWALAVLALPLAAALPKSASERISLEPNSSPPAFIASKRFRPSAVWPPARAASPSTPRTWARWNLAPIFSAMASACSPNCLASASWPFWTANQLLMRSARTCMPLACAAVAPFSARSISSEAFSLSPRRQRISAM
ncbi:hypothetical protein D3C72_680290 [compost metagenome]